jgi:acyl transferase domain-containing protein/enoyl-CoA hydratase/carnithine racemase/acyl carrier protein/SAM-dependent methyltransferase
MLEILNRYSHGLASIPIVHALRERGCLERLAETVPVSAEELAREFSANRAYLDVALRMLVCLDWIRPAADGRYGATPGLANSNSIPNGIMDLVRFPFDLYVQGDAGESLEPWLEQSERRWDSDHPYLPDFLDGLLIVPLLLALQTQKRLEVVERKRDGQIVATLRLRVNLSVRRAVERLFVAKGWAERFARTLRPNRAGRFVIDRISVTAVLASYRPMFERAQELLFGDATRAFARDSAGHETHVDRTVNVIGSGFQHGKYFAALSDLVVRCFAGDAYVSQPKYIVDMGCGDGTLLRRLFEAVRDRTGRGKVLDAYPLIPVAVDFNEKALAEASRTLAGIEHLAVRGDIGDPLALLDALRANGVEDLDRVLHVRSFLDHDRPYQQPEDRKAAERRSRAGGNVYIDAQGCAIAPGDVIQSTVEHLRRWSQIVNEHGLLVLEVHCLPPDVTSRYLDESESFHFDACHALSHQYLLDAQTFLACAAEAGLFCREGGGVGFPKHLPFTRISLSHLEWRPYVVRQARDEDLPVLEQLKEAWAQGGSRVGGDRAVPAFKNPLGEFPESEFVIETEGRVVASVRCDQDETMHLTSALLRPGAPASHLRDLLQFVEDYWALTGVGRVIGIDDCRSVLSATDDETSVACAVARDVRARVGSYPFAAEEDPRAAERELGTFSFRWVLANLQRMGVMRDAGEVYDLDALKDRLGVAPKYHRYFDALMRRLQDEGLVTVHGRQLETTPLVPDYALTSVEEQVAEFKQRFQRRFPASVGLLNMTARCLGRYDEVITGRIDITEVLFQNADLDVFAEVFRGGVVSDFFNRIVADAVYDTVVRLSATAPKIRILEIGAGTGGTTTGILEVLQSVSESVEFCFSDISLSFIRNARRRFAERYPWVEYRALNIEEDLSRQGFEAHRFDIIVAAHVLHDTRDIDLALEQVRRLLRPGGLLVMDEYTSVKDCLFFSGALLHGYWLFQDPEKRLRDSCLLGVSQWIRALERKGFAVAGSNTLPTQSLDAACSQSVMLCESLGTDDTEELPREQVAEGMDQKMGLRTLEIVGAIVEQQALTLLEEERASAYSPQRPLMDMGLDSIELVEFKSLIERRLGVKLSPMFLFEHETPEKMTAALSEMMSNQQLQGLLPPASAGGAESGDRPATGEVAEVVALAGKEGDAIAIVGVACRFPGGVVSAESFWSLLESGGHGIVSMPSGRWQWPAFVDLDGEHKGIDKAGFLERIDEFDAPFFRTSPKEAKLMDPQQRLLLELSWEVMEDGGHRPSELSGRKIGVFIGVCHGDYREVLTTASDSAEAYVATGSAYSLLSNRLSYFYDFKGPSLTVDTACSSSLFALHDAVTAIRRGDCEQALVGAANLLCSPTNSISYYRAGMLSPTGACRTFDETADGYVRGEGGAMLLLKPLAMALAEGDSIYGLVKGTSVNHGGQAVSLTAPKPEAQAAVIEAAWQAADVTAESVGYIETHGTGTRLGDPVEIGGLIEAFRRLYLARGEAWPGKPHCGLGSVKTNVGHLEGAAGLAGLIKVLMAIRHRSIPATVNFERLNPDIDLSDSPFYIVAQNQVWPHRQDERGRKLPRRAGVSAFGFGGANAHAVVEEYPSSGDNAKTQDSQCLVPLSAKNKERLIEQARRLLKFLESPIGGGDDLIAEARLSEVAYTLQIGREPMEDRVAFIVQSREDLMSVLHAYIAGDRTMPNCHSGHSEPRRARVGTPPKGELEVGTSIASKDLANLALLWVMGLDPDWSKLYGEVKPRRISLPTYPFSKERYWVETAAGGHVAANGVATAVLHPLLHSNTSDLSEQRYSSTFTGEEFFLADYQVKVDGRASQKILPGVAYLEMARAAIERALPARSNSTVLELQNTVWAQPMVVTQNQQISIVLLVNDDDQIDYEIYSQDGEQEIVHCQGRAVLSDQPAPAALDLTQLEDQMEQGEIEPNSVYAACARMGLVHGPSFHTITAIHRGRNQILAQLRLPRTIENTLRDYVLHPSLLDGVLQVCIGLIDGLFERVNQPLLPFAVESVRIVSPCTRDIFAWVRYSPNSQAADAVVRVDIDLCDALGNICAQMRGVSWQQGSVNIFEILIDTAASPVVPATIEVLSLCAPVCDETMFGPSAPGTSVSVERKKAVAVSLATPSATALSPENAVRQFSVKRGPVTLSSPPLGMSTQEGEATDDSSASVFDCGNGVFSIQIAASVSSNTRVQDWIVHLLQPLNRVQQAASLRALIFNGLERCFPRGGREACNNAVEQGFYQALVSFPVPVIAVLQGDAIGASFMAASLCDFMVCNEDATYGYTDANTHLYPTPPEMLLFSERFGEVNAQHFLYLSTASTGKQLRMKGWTCPMLPGAQVEAYAQELASTLATKSLDALRLLKQHLARHLVGLVKELTFIEAAAPATEDMIAKTIASPATHIHLDTPVEHVLVITFGKAAPKDLVGDLSRIFAEIHQGVSYKAVVLVSEHREFLSGTEHAIPEDVVLDFQRLVGELAIPVVGALAGNAKGDAWLISQFCDACVYSQTGVYSSVGMGYNPVLAQTAAVFFTYRFGNSVGEEILLTSADYSGIDLQRRVGTLAVAAHDQVLLTAVQMAESWAKLPRATLAAWKNHSAKALQKKILSKPAAAVWEQTDKSTERLATAPMSIPLHSRVVTATAHPEGIVVVKMEDREAKNMFSDALIDGITEAFALIEQTPAYKVVILTGYDSYFASGGTKANLLAIQRGKVTFTDFRIIQLPLDCKLPVIAAMQGHGIGAGWTLGVFADLVLLSEESRYVSPYMDYGFTPGGGATWILADKIGLDLARESLLTARPYAGSELKQRGLLLPVLPRIEVYPAAMALAKNIAKVPRGRLISLKQQLTGYVHQSLKETYQLELAMHDDTFVGHAATLAHIQNGFYQDIDTPSAAPRQTQVETANTSVDSDVLSAITESLKTLLGNELQMREGDIDDNAQFVDLGLDSITGVMWIRKINEKYHTAIQATKVYSYPTLAQLSRYVQEEAAKLGTPPNADVLVAVDMHTASKARASSQSTSATTLAVKKLASRRTRVVSRFNSSTPAVSPSHPIAIIGMAGQFPKAKNLDEFWQNIAQGRNCITQVPPHRWDVNAYYQPGDAVAGKTISQWAGSLDEYDLFDPAFFNISPTEAESMDPQQRLFLQACWHSIENAGYDARVLSGSKCGVFVGCATGDYHQLSREHQLSAQGFTGSAMSILAARISYFLNLQGPCISIDTACSSSLVALAQACDSLTSGGSDLALAGGVYVMTGPEMHIKTSQAGMLSPEGKCFTFDQRADGFVPGEGVGVVLLKRLSDARRDQDIICGVIEGWGVNQDGKTNGITAPNPESQTRLEQEVYDKYQIDPANIQLIEAHGTGTKLGDPIEVEGLSQTFRRYTQKRDYCALGSVKSNIGHCLWAAGIAGVLKLVLALRHKQLPPTINFEQLNEHIDLKDSPFYVNRHLQVWEITEEKRRQAAIGSFGFSGTNAYMVVGEYRLPAESRPPVAAVTQNTKIIVPLSARTAEQLQQKARDLLDFIRKEGPSVDLIKMAFTLQVGRQTLEERVGFLVSSVEKLAENLVAYIEGKPEIKDFYQGQVRRSKESMSVIIQDDEIRETIVAKWLAARKLSKLLDLWVKGLDLDWNKLYGEVKPQRISLPTYPFAKERYWIETAAGGNLAAEGATMAVLHPLLHNNTSDLSEQRYNSTFTGDEFFLAEHRVRTGDGTVHKVLPGVALLEMARAAIEQALPVRSELTVLELRNSVWPQPMVVIQNKRVSIALLANDNDQIDYEIYSQDGEEEIVHCQGGAVWIHKPAPARLDIEQLKGQMGKGKVEPNVVYAAFAQMGIFHGPSFQAITAIHQGSNQLLAYLRLPATVEGTSGDYVLHPSLMDAALQGHVGLIVGWSEGSDQTRLPFALETLRILSPCTSEMVAWARFSPGSQATDNLVKLDVDLCDAAGNVCVQMHGFSSRLVSNDSSKAASQGRAIGSLLATPVWQASSIAADAAKREYAEHHVILCDLAKISTRDLGSLVWHSHCLSLQSEQQKNIAQRYSEYALACFERIQTILQGRAEGEVLVQIVVGDHREQAIFAGLSGLLKTAKLENPLFTGQLILVPVQTTADDLAAKLRAEKHFALDTLIRYEDGGRQVLRWQEVPEGYEKPPLAFKDYGVYLITGGMGGLGLIFAKEILGQTRQARVVLASRSALTAERQAFLEGLSAQAGRVVYRQVDVGEIDQVKQLLAATKDEYGQLNGILHSAGMIADNFILKKASAEFSGVLASKVTGTLNLDQASQDVELDFFVLFSSIAGAMGNAGQADYATANGFLDQFAAYRNRQVAARQRHGRTLSIDWPLWQAGGMGIDQVIQELLQQTTGMQPMQTATGMDAFYRSLALPYDQTLAGEGDLTQIRRALLADPPAPPEPRAEQLLVAAEIDSGSLTEKTQDYLREQFSRLLKLPSHNINPQAALEKYGVDSILAMKLTNQFEKTFGSLSKTLFFEYQTIRALAEYFVQSYPARLATLFATSDNSHRQPEPADAGPETRPSAQTALTSSRRFSRRRSAALATTTDADPIAMIGLSGRYPEAINIDAYWHNLSGGKDCIIEVPKARWDWQTYFSDDRSQSGRHYSKWGGFIDGVDEFDAPFFNISPREAKMLDPQERLFLEHAWIALEDAGYTRASLQVPNEQDLEGQVGVYVGVWSSEYQLFGAEASMQGERVGFAISVASIANRVSYALDLHGPSMALDTMCSSSLTAIHLACQDLRLGRISVAIAGGVNINIHPNKYLMLSSLQAISTDGHCRSFGEGGDGYVPAEGVGVVVLKRLSHAQRDGDHIYGIVRGSALNHGGKTNGYTVPNPQAQTSAVSRALAESKTDARHISYIEAHGTGTKLGDPIEIAALNKAFHRYTQDTKFCMIGSVKSNIGHCESAAGIAGLTKVLLQMQHQQLVPSLHSAELNSHIDFHMSPFVVNQALRTWEQPVIDGRRLPRIAGISSFGAGGSNAHLIVEEYQQLARQPVAFAKVVILLSAKTAAQLMQKARDLFDFIHARLNSVDLVAMAYTLQVGREVMEERLGFVVSSVEQLAEKLLAYVDGEHGIEGAYQGTVKRTGEALSVFGTDVDLQHTIDKWFAHKKLSKLVDLWAKGLELDWSKLYSEPRPQRISLPTYPFAKERHWIDTAVRMHMAAKDAAPDVFHPLLHSNTSDMTEQCYRSTFTGEEFFLADHQVKAGGRANQKVLPGVAYLEMARAAVEHAMPARPESTVLELRNTVWAQPIIISANAQVSLALLANANGEIDYEIFSQNADQEIVHCQGRAVSSVQPAPGRLDLDQLKEQMEWGKLEPKSVYAACTWMGLLYGPSFQAITAIDRGRDQLLAQLRLPRTVEDTLGDYVLHPSLMDGALQACVGLIDGWSEGSAQPRLLRALETLRIVSSCSRDMVAWVRYSQASQAADQVVKVDIDLCDVGGNVSVQMRGVSFQQVSLDLVEAVFAQAAIAAVPAAPADVAGAAPVRKEIVFTYQPAPPVSMERKKPAAIPLAAPNVRATTVAEVLEHKVQPTGSAARITLSNATRVVPLLPESEVSAFSSVRLFDDGNGIFSIQIAASERNGSPSQDVIAHMLQALDRVQHEAMVKVLIISGLERCFPRGGREDCNAAVEQMLYHAIVSFPYPVIAALLSDAIGAGFLTAALCDFMVCDEDATYGYTDANADLYPTLTETMLFAERFGDVQAQDFLYISTAATGRQLRTEGWMCPILPGTRVQAYAHQLASTLATKSRDALRLLKQHLTRHLLDLVKALTRVEVPAPPQEDRTAGVATTIASPSAYIHLETSGEHVLVIRFSMANEQLGVKDLVLALGDIFAAVHQGAYYKAIVLTSEDPEFLPGSANAIPEEVVVGFQRLVVESQIPIVAALDRNATGNAWLISQTCDACVYSRTGVYSLTTIGLSSLLAQTAAALFTHRLGNSAGREILLTGADYSGIDLQRRIGGLTVADQDHVLPTAVQVAESLAKLPRATVVAWKEYTAAKIHEKARSLPSAWAEIDDTLNLLPFAPIPIALHSKVVTATAHPGGIVVVKMEDREAKNMFSDAFVEGVREAFVHIEQTPAYKVVILTGYDNYFVSGGTKEGLVAIQEGKARFTDLNIYHVALDCKLPVIAAMQGHGIGAGLSLGMFADIVLLSEESRYISPYMNYGFTPGAGATWILADKIGQDLARESLLTAEHYAGREWKDRGLRLSILPRAEVYPAALRLARQIAQFSRPLLIGLKQQMADYIRRPLEEIYRLELAMHEKTFVGHADTLARIQNIFFQEIETPTAGRQQTQVEPAGPSADSDVLPAVTATLRSLLANELQMRKSDIDDNTQFVDLGLESISAVTWVRRINEKYHTSIEATKIYSYPTLTQLSRYVKAEAEKHDTLSPDPTRAADKPVTSGTCVSTHNKIVTNLVAEKLTSLRSRTASRFVPGAVAASPSSPIAIVGMAGQFPRARNLEEFWQNLAEGRDCIAKVPHHRWDVNLFYQPGDVLEGKTNSQWLGALEDYDLFDPLFFNISPTEAESMDPQQRLFLQACWHSIENAGYDARVLSGSRCGVFVGCATGDYHQLSRKHQLSAQGFTGSSTSILAARISYFLNLQGPCVSIDTACSSSLVALAQACDSLASGVSDLALAGGVCVLAGPELHVQTAQAGMLSPEGKCFTFDQRADGFVPGEGVGVVLLKRLADAQKDQDIIHAVIDGWGVNQDGKTNGITAPNPDSQTRLEQEVYDKYHIDPAGIQLIEAHGTGTKLGDPIEVEGLRTAFGKYTQNKAYCALGSVKSNIGHCLTAAGIAGVLKLVLALKHRQLPPTINFERLNEHIDIKDSPFYVNGRLQEWAPRDAQHRRAAISSFGFSGTNAHMVISEFLPPAEASRPVSVGTPNTNIIIPLSARTEEQLRQKVIDLSAFIRHEPVSIDLIEMAYTLQMGRAALDERLGFIVNSVDDLAAQLEAYVNGERDIKDFRRGQVKRSNESLSIISQDDDLKDTVVAKWIAEEKLSKLLGLWVTGLELDWSKLYGEVKPRRISLPSYPFAKERYWIDTSADEPVLTAAAPTTVIHPLLHRNTSDLSSQRYSSLLTGAELFLTDHRVRTDGRTLQKVLPGVAYLEMARAAIEHASPIRQDSSVVELLNTVWLRPLVVTEHKEISIALAVDGDALIGYEIYSIVAGQKVIHCQGQAGFCRQPRPLKLDIEQLRLSMEQGRLDASDIYVMFARMGLGYGSAHQGIVAMYLGDEQLLAQLQLPAVVEASQHEYVLHPSLLDSALQASVGLIVDVNRVPDKPSVPFALESLRILSACTKEMLAWVRYVEGRSPDDKAVKLDIDVCDQQGNVCVQLRGFAWRALEGDAASAQSSMAEQRIPMLADRMIEPDCTFDDAFYQNVIADIVNQTVSVEEAVELG